MHKVNTVTEMLKKSKGRFCSLVIDNSRVSRRRIAAKIVDTKGQKYAMIHNLRTHETRRVQYSSIASIGCGEFVYSR